jgi:hypothetical protein
MFIAWRFYRHVFFNGDLNLALSYDKYTLLILLVSFYRRHLTVQTEVIFEFWKRVSGFFTWRPRRFSPDSRVLLNARTILAISDAGADKVFLLCVLLWRLVASATPSFLPRTWDYFGRDIALPVHWLTAGWRIGFRFPLNCMGRQTAFSELVGYALDGRGLIPVSRWPSFCRVTWSGIVYVSKFIGKYLDGIWFRHLCGPYTYTVPPVKNRYQRMKQEADKSHHSSILAAIHWTDFCTADSWDPLP